MNKKILILALLQICLFATASFAQTCPDPLPSCILDQHVDNGSTDWYTSHGTISFTNNNAPTPQSSSSQSINMWSYLNMGSGAFTCYGFQQGKTYRVCFWVRNTSGWPSNPFGRLYVYAANSLTNNTYGYPVTPPSVSKQLIDQSYYGPPQGMVHPSGVSDWEFISTTFTANYNYSYLWIFPLNPEGPPPPGPVQYNLEYKVEVDDIRVMEEPTTPPYTLSVTDTKNPIDGCNDQTQITISGMPAGSVATWTPAVTQVATDWSVVIAKPCSTTTYKIEISDPNSSCATCIREVLNYTVNVNQWSDPVNLVYPSTVPCTGTINLDYNDPATCSPVTYIWIDPQGNTYPGKTVSVTNANAYQTGEWTLQIWILGKGCAEEQKFNITVGSCCISSPSFTFNPNTNPVSFTNTSTGITNHVATLWNFGDGNTSDQNNPIHTYNVTTPTLFTVCLTMLYEDGQGESCCNRFCDVVQVAPNSNACLVNANFDFVAVNGWGNTFDFIDGSTGNGVICNYQWDFGDGTIINTTVPTIRHTYSASPPGPWTVCLTVTNCVYDANGTLVNSCTNFKCWTINPVVMIGMPDLSSPSIETQLQTAPLQVTTPNGKQTNERILIIYPNPNRGEFAVNLYKRSGDYNVIVRDAQGREVYKRKHAFNNMPVEISLTSAAAGVYSVEVFNESEKFAEQISVIK